MVEHVTITWGTAMAPMGNCVICKDPLCLRFPEDFPDEFKFCCMCRTIAEMVVLGEPIIYIDRGFHRIVPSNRLINKIDVWLTIGA